MAETMGRGLVGDGVLLFGRRTYEQFRRFWSGQADGNPYTEVLNRKHKYVAPRGLTQPLPWRNSSLLTGGRGRGGGCAQARPRRRAGGAR